MAYSIGVLTTILIAGLGTYLLGRRAWAGRNCMRDGRDDLRAQRSTDWLAGISARFGDGVGGLDVRRSLAGGARTKPSPQHHLFRRDHCSCRVCRQSRKPIRARPGTDRLRRGVIGATIPSSPARPDSPPPGNRPGGCGCGRPVVSCSVGIAGRSTGKRHDTDHSGRKSRPVCRPGIVIHFPSWIPCSTVGAQHRRRSLSGGRSRVPYHRSHRPVLGLCLLGQDTEAN